MRDGLFNVPVGGVVLKNAYPINIASIPLSNSSENSVVQVTVTFAYDNWYEQSEIAGVGTAVSTGLSAITNSINTVRNIGKALF